MKIEFYIITIATLLNISGCKSTPDKPTNRTVSIVTCRVNVNAPGEYTITQDSSLLEALVMAGGVKFLGGGPLVWITRGEKRYSVNVLELMDKGKSFVLCDGDVITVPHQGCFGGMTEDEINSMNDRMKEYIKQSNHGMDRTRGEAG